MRWTWVEALTLVITLAVLVTAFSVGGDKSIPAPPTAAVVEDSTAGPGSHPDALLLRAWSDGAGVPWMYTHAIAWRETRNNPSPWTRGGHGEYGRFQILPSTARLRCARIDVTSYDGNLACFVKLAREDLAACRGDVRCAARVHNGSGPRARAYADSVAAIVRNLVRMETGL